MADGTPIGAEDAPIPIDIEGATAADGSAAAAAGASPGATGICSNMLCAKAGFAASRRLSAPTTAGMVFDAMTPCDILFDMTLVSLSPLPCPRLAPLRSTAPGLPPDRHTRRPIADGQPVHLDDGRFRTGMWRLWHRTHRNGDDAADAAKTGRT
ncbi:hypothetical protein GCM10007887_34850 [Methylobacterium haplocladii]|nr:hypothetical protein GCM10007887_34850 [Methylobacterium haplocladii]